MAAFVCDLYDPDEVLLEDPGFLRWVLKEMKLLQGSSFDFADDW